MSIEILITNNRTVIRRQQTFDWQDGKRSNLDRRNHVLSILEEIMCLFELIFGLFVQSLIHGR